MPARPRSDFDWFDPALTAGYAPKSFAALGASNLVPAPQATEPVAPTPVPAPEIAWSDVPIPMPRPAFAPRPDARPAPEARRRLAGVAPPSERPGFFDRMFGGSRPAGPALAYAAPDDGGGLAGMLGRRVSAPDSQTAVYDIGTHTVTLPNGVRLEAHSGLGTSYDNPRSVTEHMRGATPPAVYDLTLREGLFHGVQALRLNPIDPAATYGRMGLLAHSYMLGPRGESNGCVVFRNYAAFLQAYESGSVRRLAVVSGSS